MWKKNIIEDLPGQFRAYSIGGWFLEKVSSDDQKLLETKEKKIRATCAISAETSSRSQFHERRQGFTPSAIQDNFSAIEDNSSPIKENSSAIDNYASLL